MPTFLIFIGVLHLAVNAAPWMASAASYDKGWTRFLCACIGMVPASCLGAFWLWPPSTGADGLGGFWNWIFCSSRCRGLP